MGCGGSSTPQVSPAHRKKMKDILDVNDNQPNNNQDEDDPDYVRRMLEISKALKDSVDFIIKCISKIPKVSKIRPLVCLNEYAAPLAISIISLTTGNSTEIYLPVAGLSIFKGRHIILLGQIDMITHFDTSNPDACAFLENSVRWAGGFGRSKYFVLILGLDFDDANNLAQIMQGFDFLPTILDQLPDDDKPLQYHVIITTMNTPYVDKLQKFLGGLIIGVRNVQSKNPNQLNFHPEMVKFMLEYGFGFPNFSLEVGSPSSESIKTSRSFKDLKEITLLNLIKKYKLLTESETDIVTSQYDNLVTSLRYHIITLQRKENINLLKLAKCAYEFLKSKNYEIENESIKNNDNKGNKSDNENDEEVNDTENDPFQCNTVTATSYSYATQVQSLICPSIIHCITSVLLTEIMPRLHPLYFQDQHFGKRFPGEIDEELARMNLADFRTHHEILCDQWCSTGLYLPSGVVATATISKHLIGSMKNKVKLSVQVGCHTVCTLSNKGPWKRWPLISDSFAFPSKNDIISYEKYMANKDEKKFSSGSIFYTKEVSPYLFYFDESKTNVSIDICSPFGGIVYIVAEDFMLDKPIDIEVVFQNLLQFPIYSASDPSAYNDFMNMINQFNVNTGKINYNGSLSDMFSANNQSESSASISSNRSSQTQRLSHTNNSSAIASKTSISIERPVLCPWMEIETQFIEISIPTERVGIFGDLDKYCGFLDAVLSELLQFTMDESQKPYRLVFDIELPNDKPVCDYPITMPMRMIFNLSQTKPSSELLFLLFYIASLSIYQINFDKMDCESLAMVAAFHAFIITFQDKFPGIDPMEYMVESPPILFGELWNIYLDNGSDCFVNSFDDIRQKFEMRPILDGKKVWTLFVTKISHHSGKQYDEKLIQKKEEVKNTELLSASSRSLLQFQLKDTREMSQSAPLPTLDE